MICGGMVSSRRFAVRMFLQKMYAGRRVCTAMLEPRIDTMPAGCLPIAIGVEKYIVLTKMLTVFAGWVVHRITSIIVYSK